MEPRTCAPTALLSTRCCEAASLICHWRCCFDSALAMRCRGAVRLGGRNHARIATQDIGLTCIRRGLLDRCPPWKRCRQASGVLGEALRHPPRSFLGQGRRRRRPELNPFICVSASLPLSLFFHMTVYLSLSVYLCILPCLYI